MADNTYYRVEYKTSFGDWRDSYWGSDGFDTQDEAEGQAEEVAGAYRNVRVRKTVESNVVEYTDGVKNG